ncbi:unnamed protein product [Dicrocoelium dendriticum]|nr:unnamed protein product [Dicrocoelium dendriticum]
MEEQNSMRVVTQLSRRLNTESASAATETLTSLLILPTVSETSADLIINFLFCSVFTSEIRSRVKTGSSSDRLVGDHY